MLCQALSGFCSFLRCWPVLSEMKTGKMRVITYTVIHLLVVDGACVLFWTQSACMVPNQNTRNIYHKQMNNGVRTRTLEGSKRISGLRKRYKHMHDGL